MLVACSLSESIYTKNPFRKRASGAFLGFRPTELAREGLSVAQSATRESHPTPLNNHWLSIMLSQFFCAHDEKLSCYLYGKTQPVLC